MTWNNWNRKEDSKYQTMLIALLAGAGAGLAVGLLMAPKSGGQLRAEIKDALDEQFGAARHKADDLKNSAVNLAQRGIKEIQRTKDYAAQRTKTAVSNAVGGAARQAHDAVDQTADAARSAAQKTHEAIDGAAGAVRSESAA